VKRDAITMRSGMSSRFWLTVDVPESTAPGTYSATAVVRGDGIADQRVQLALEVPPVRLDPVPEGIEFSTSWGIRGAWSPTPDGGYFAITRRMDPALAKSWVGILKGAMFERTRAEFALMKRYGITLIYRRAEFFEMCPENVALPTEIETMLPQVPAGKLEGRWYVGGLGLTALADMNAGKVAAMKDAGQRPVLLGPPKLWEDVKEEAGIYRFCAGFLLWRLDAAGCLFSPWANFWGDPYHPFDSHCGEWGSLCMPASHDWPTLNRSVLLEGIRDGIVDYRHLVTLERLIREHPGVAAATEGAAYLQQLKDSIEPTAEHYFFLVGGKGGHDFTWSQKDTCWTGAQYTEARRSIVGFIARLQQER
jgi:hypothetical protein